MLYRVVKRVTQLERRGQGMYPTVCFVIGGPGSGEAFGVDSDMTEKLQIQIIYSI